jgi:DnaJ-class molecular chaperone
MVTKNCARCDGLGYYPLSETTCLACGGLGYRVERTSISPRVRHLTTGDKVMLVVVAGCVLGVVAFRLLGY